MNNVTSLYVRGHDWEVTGPCDPLALNSNMANNIRLVQNNLSGTYEISCGISDAPAQKEHVSIADACITNSQTECKTMNYFPLLDAKVIKYPKPVPAATGIEPEVIADDGLKAKYGQLNEVDASINEKKHTTSATFIFGRVFKEATPGAGPKARQIKTLTIDTNARNIARVIPTWYKA